MENILTNFFTTFKAEHIKKKGTWINLLSFILGVITPILFFIISVIRDDQVRNDVLPYNYYWGYIENCLDPFASFFFPLLIIIMVSRITQIDHKNGGWQLMETQPTYKFSIYFSKFCVALEVNLISIVSFVVSALLSAWILSFIKEVSKAADKTFPITDIIHVIALLFVASLFVTALQYVISVLIPAFIWSIVIGFFALLLTVFLKPFGLLPDWYPYEILFKVSSNKNGSDLGYWFTYSEYAGIFCTIIILYIGFQWYKFKKLWPAFFEEKMKTVKLLSVVIVFGGLLLYVLKPKQMQAYKSTVLCGKMTSDMNLKYVYIIDHINSDTVATIPIKDGSFYHQFDKNIVLDDYFIQFDDKIQRNIFFGNNDSVFTEGKFLNGQTELNTRGTRLAENKAQSNDENKWSQISYLLDQNSNLSDVNYFSKQLYKEWKNRMEAFKTFKTLDNYIPRMDYSERNKKLITVTYLDYWDSFVKKRKALFPGEETKMNADIKKLKDNVSLNDESLLSSDDYFKYVNNQLIAGDKQDTDLNTLSIRAIAKLPDGSFRDKMLYMQLKKSLVEVSHSAERNELVTQYAVLLKNNKYRERINYLDRILENLSSGSPAPDFTAITTEGKTISLSEMKGKYVAIDVWATWCRPCKIQSPFFEKFAMKYKSQPVQFVGLSVDERKDKWFIEAKSKLKTVLQLHSNDAGTFKTNYNILTIPRFILIDPLGNFINSDMPFPDQNAFEILLRKALSLPDEK